MRLLPSRWMMDDKCGQIWNIDPAHDRQRTALDDVPTPTDKKVIVPGAYRLLANLLSAGSNESPDVGK